MVWRMSDHRKYEVKISRQLLENEMVKRARVVNELMFFEDTMLIEPMSLSAVSEDLIHKKIVIIQCFHAPINISILVCTIPPWHNF